MKVIIPVYHGTYGHFQVVGVYTDYNLAKRAIGQQQFSEKKIEYFEVLLNDGIGDKYGKLTGQNQTQSGQMS